MTEPQLYFVVTILEEVGDLQFEHKTLAIGETESAVEKAVWEAMPTFRGKGYETSGGCWDSGGVMASLESIKQIPSDLGQQLLYHDVLPVLVRNVGEQYDSHRSKG